MKKILWNEYISIGAMVIGIASLILSMVVPGPQGPAGLPGSNGINGSNGTNGVDGSNGMDGSNGVNGSNGVDGQDGEAMEFQIIDGVMMYRIGEGPWQAYSLDGSTFDFGIIEDERYQSLIHYHEESVELSGQGLKPLHRQVIFEPVIDQMGYVNDRINEGYLPIETVEDFLAIDDDLSERYVLTTNLDFTGNVYTGSLIGNGGSGFEFDLFEGTFDGAGFTLSNVIIESNHTAIGLFAGLGLDARVGNVTLSSFFIEATLTDETLFGVGALTGFINERAYIENITIVDSLLLASQHAGFVAGQLISEQDPFINEFSLLHLIHLETSRISSPLDNGYALGGLVGKVSGGRHNFFNNSIHQLTIQDGVDSIGGLLGLTQDTQIDLLFNSLEMVFLNSEMEGLNFGLFIGGVDFTFLTMISNSVQSAHIDTPQSTYIGGLIGGVITGINTFMVSNFIVLTTLEGFSNVGGFIGGQHDSGLPFTLSIFASSNASEVAILGEENLGGFSGEITRGEVILSSNIIDTIISEGKFRMGGLFGTFNDYSGLLLVGNRVHLRLYLTLSLNSASDYYSVAQIGGHVGRVGENILILSAHNRTQLQLSVTFLGDDGEHTGLEGMSMYSVGGAYGSTSDSPIIAIDGDVFQTSILLIHRFTELVPGLEYNINHYGIGGLIGYQQASNTTLRVHTTLIDLEMEQSFERMPRNVSLTTHKLGGLIGSMESSEIDLHHVKVSFVYRIQTYPETQQASTWENVYLIHFDIGGLIGYTSGIFSSIEYTDLHVELSISLLMSKLPLVLGTSYVGLRDVGGLIGFIEESMYLEGERAIVDTYIGVSSNMVTMANIMNQTTLDEGFLQLENLAGLIGNNTSNFTNMFIQDTYVRLDMASSLLDSIYMDAFALAIGENLTSSYGLLGVNVYGYSPTEIVYGEGYFIFDFMTQIESFNAWIALLDAFDTSWAHWAYDDTSLTLTFFDPTLRLS